MNVFRILRHAPLILAAVAGGFHAGCKPQPPPAAQAPAAAPVAAPLPDYAEALVRAFQFGSAIPADAHLDERSGCQYKALKAMLDLGLAAEAERHAPEIMDYRRGLLYADLAMHCARRGGDVPEMRRYLDEARAWRDSLDPDEHNVAWHSHRITGRMALALATAKLFDEADAIGAGVEAPDLAQVAIEKLGTIDNDADYEETRKQLEAMGKEPIWELQDAAVRTWARILENQGATLTSARVADILAQVEETVSRLPMVRHCLVRCAVARALLGGGQRDPGLKVLADTVAGFKAGKPVAEFDVANLVEVANVYDEAAKLPEEAGKSLQLAAALLRDQGAALGRSERHSAMVALATGYAVHGDRDAAGTLFQEALGVAQGQVNGRPRHMMIADLCVAIGRCRYPLSAELRTALDQQWNRRGEPW